jgi:hypothetical protein
MVAVSVVCTVPDNTMCPEVNVTLKIILSQVGWLVPVIPALDKLRWEDHEFKAA